MSTTAIQSEFWLYKKLQERQEAGLSTTASDLNLWAEKEDVDLYFGPECDLDQFLWAQFVLSRITPDLRVTESGARYVRELSVA